MTNSVDSGETAPYEPSHLDLHCLKSICTGLQGRKGKRAQYLVDPFMPSGPSYLNSLDWSISNRRNVWLVFISAMFLQKFLHLMQTV